MIELHMTPVLPDTVKLFVIPKFLTYQFPFVFEIVRYFTFNRLTTSPKLIQCSLAKMCSEQTQIGYSTGKCVL